MIWRFIIGTAAYYKKQRSKLAAYRCSPKLIVQQIDGFFLALLYDLKRSLIAHAAEDGAESVVELLSTISL